MPGPGSVPPRPPVNHVVKWHIKRIGRHCDPRPYLQMWRGLHRKREPVDLLVAMPRFAPGGVEQLTVNLLEALYRRGYRAIVLITGQERPVPSERLAAIKDDVVMLPAVPERLSRLFIRRVAANSGARTVLITHSEVTYSTIKSIKELRPNLRIVDVLHTHGRPEDNDGFLRIRMTAREHIDLAVTVSDFLRRYMLERGYESEPHRVTVIPNAIPPRSNDHLRSNACTDELRVLWLGRVDSDKDPLAVFEVAAALSAMTTTRRVSITLAGSGSLLHEAERRAAEFDTRPVRVVGHVDDVDELLVRHDVLLNTSQMEGQPLTVLEALDAGLAVVAYRVGGLPELANMSDLVTLVCRERGPEGLAAALLDSKAGATSGTTAAADRWRQHVDAYESALGLATGLPARAAD